MTALRAFLNTAFLHSLWESALIAAMLGATLSALRRNAPNARYVAGCIALALMAVLPLLTAAASTIGMTRERIVAVESVDLGDRPDSVAFPVIIETVPARSTWINRLSSLQPWILPCWCAGVLLFSLRLALSAAGAAALKRRTIVADASIRATVDRLRACLGVAQRVEVRTGIDVDGPAALGWLRPVILLPPATLMGLTPHQLEAVLAHELAHIRRHDYLVNLVQMVVETLFFYHPAIWWASRRIRAERELCCDDIAVAARGNAVDYARALTALAQMTLSRSGIVLGATDGPFAARIKRLLGMTVQETQSSWGALVAVALVVTVAVLNLSATPSASSGPLVFDAAVLKPHESGGPGGGGCRGIDSRLGIAALSFRPRVNAPTTSVPLGRCVLTNMRLDGLISLAFAVPPQRIVGVPAWARNVGFDLQAKAEDPATTTERQLLSMLQQFLTEQFRLIVHRDTKDGPTFALVVAKNGPKNLQPSQEERESMLPQGTSLAFRDFTMQGLVDFLSMMPTVERPVIDKTGIRGRFDFTIRDVLPSPTDDVITAKIAMSQWQGLFSDIQQLGLRLQSSTGPIETLVIDHAERPHEN